MFQYAKRKKVLQHPSLWMLFTCLTVFSMAACAGGASSPGPASAATSTPTPSPTPMPSPTPTPSPTSTPSPTPTPPLTPTPSPAPASFKVTSVAMAVKPTSIAGMACGTAITVTYTATFHIAANSPGGPIHFLYTSNNGRGSPSASITVGPGKTTATYAYTWSGKLPADHTLPSYGGVIVTSPNAVRSPLVKPAGMCS